VNGCAGTSCAQLQETYEYNNRLQPSRMQLGTSPVPSANTCLVYNYYSVANPTSCAIPGQGTGNNGNVMGYLYQDTTNPGLGHTASYAYDALNRLTNSVATGSSTHNLTFGYDRYGNMTCVLYAQTQGPCPSWGYNALTNRITNTGFIYDAGGFLTQDGTGPGTHSYQYDAEGRLIGIDNGSTMTTKFNALGQPVERITPSYQNERLFDPWGGLIAYWNTSLGNWGFRRILLDGRTIAYYNEPGIGE
jgi:YD repeat-containing protein